MATPNDDGVSARDADPANTSLNHDSILPDAERKRFEHLRALLALRDGHAVHRLAEGGYLVEWKSWTRECRDLAELEAHARRVGAMA